MCTIGARHVALFSYIAFGYCSNGAPRERIVGPLLLGFARRAQVPDMLGVVEQEWVRHSPEKKPPPV